MTIQEALDYLNQYRNAGNHIHREAMDMAIEALEKQRMKTPNYESDGYWNGELVYDTWICPCCGKAYEVDYDNYKYCRECGQAIDWGDTE